MNAATKTFLRPLTLRTFDYLLIDWDDKTFDFKAKAVAMRPYERKTLFDDEDVKPIVHNGQEFRLDRTIASYGAREWIKRIPESRAVPGYENEGWWIIAATDYTVLALRGTWPRERLVFINDFAKTTFEFIEKRFDVQSRRAETQARWKIEGEMPEMPTDFLDHPDYPLSDAQKLGVQLSLGAEGFALFMDKGTGKTAVTLNRICNEAARHKRNGGDMFRACVIVPNQVRLNWQNETFRFATLQGKVTIIRGGKMRRIKLLTEAIKAEQDCDFSIVVIGIDTFAIDVELFCKMRWNLGVVDEIHYAKWYQSRRAKALFKFREVCDMRMGLTGTPIGNTHNDLWSQLEFLGEGMSGFKRFKDFRHFFGKYEKNGAGHGVERLVELRNIPFLQERLARICFMVSKEEAGLGLPDKLYDTIEVEMTKDQTEIYNRIAKELAVELDDLDIENIEPSKRSLTVNHVLTQLLRLAQVTSGHIKWDPEFDLDTGDIIHEGKVEQIPGDVNPKVEALIESLREDDKNCKAVIWCCFKEDIRVIEERLAKETADPESPLYGVGFGSYYGATREKDREERVERFNCDPTFRFLIANPQTAGEGLDLLGYDKNQPEASDTHAGHEYFFSQNWSFLQRSQAEDRCHRRGTRHPVQITDLTVPGTIDEEIRERVLAKQSLADMITNIKGILRNVLQYAE